MDSNEITNPFDEQQIEQFVKRQKELLKLERSAFVESQRLELKELGNCLSVKLVKTFVPIYGGTIVSFKSLLSKTKTKFPAFRIGNLVCVDLLDGANPLNGILLAITAETFDVHIKDPKELLNEREIFELVKTNDDGEFEQLEIALDGIIEKPTKLINTLFGLSPPSDHLVDARSEAFVPINKTLDESQKAAVSLANEQKELAVIHGPPGTGKTTTLVEVISQVRLFTTITKIHLKYAFHRQSKRRKGFFSVPQAIQ